jgi:hypothetical protein
LKWELEQFNNGIKEGVPKDDRYVDNYLEKMARHNGNLIQWLEDFKVRITYFQNARKKIIKLKLQSARREEEESAESMLRGM